MKKIKKKTTEAKNQYGLHPYLPKLSSRINRGLVLALVMYVAINILATQYIHPLYFSLMNEKEDAAVYFIRSLQFTPWYNTFLATYSHIFGSSFLSTINQPLIKRDNQIRYYESLLSYNQNNPNLLFVLSSLYREAGDGQTADSYLKRARALDPSVGQ